MKSEAKAGAQAGRGLLVAALAAALLGSNLWWLYLVVDAGVTQGYTESGLEQSAAALDQCLAALPVAARPGATRDEILAALRPASDPAGDREFTRDGFLWIGGLGVRFDATGRLTAVRKGWEPVAGRE